MSSEIVVALLGLLGTLAGSFLGVLSANKLVQYRLQQLENKVNKHNNLIERMYKCEDRLNLVEHDILDIRGDMK